MQDGVDIQKVSKKGSSEAEVLFQSNTKFKILSFEENANDDYHGCVNRVALEELV
jgi:hypothetical protein